MRWYAGTNISTMAFGDGPYAGELNTAIIIASQGEGDGANYAARICNELQITVGGKTYGDWYLPSKEELNLMYQNRSTITITATANGGADFADGDYWSSSESSSTNTWSQHFFNGYQNPNNKNYPQCVRAVRAF